MLFYKSLWSLPQNGDTPRASPETLKWCCLPLKLHHLQATPPKSPSISLCQADNSGFKPFTAYSDSLATTMLCEKCYSNLNELWADTCKTPAWLLPAEVQIVWAITKKRVCGQTCSFSVFDCTGHCIPFLCIWQNNHFSPDRTIIQKADKVSLINNVMGQNVIEFCECTFAGCFKAVIKMKMLI